jgi:hypothetical protein
MAAEQPDLTLDEIAAAMRKRRVPGSRTAVWRFFARHDLTFKKSLHAAEQQRPDVARARRRWRREQFMFDPARLVFIDETAASTDMVRLLARATDQGFDNGLHHRRADAIADHLDLVAPCSGPAMSMTMRVCIDALDRMGLMP